uniref:Uncharacterized protein n=1 Tax=Globodera rostochiensis TaxID=31243 RepID=A0A914H1X9_GLORO
MIDLRLLIAKKGLLIPPCSAHCFLLRSFYTENESSRQDSFRLPVLPKKSRSSGEPFSFVDYKRVFCEAGKGGDGRISFLRLKNIEFGGPDGGNGGNGGHVIFRADSKITDLSHLNDILKAPEGIDGQESCAHGKNGEHLFQNDARGGAGGHGNAFYLSNMVRKPLKAEEGGRGEETRYDIEMRIMATAGLVGIPNVGKSTLLRAISRAKPKVAAYPFTTLNPSVGMVQYGDFFQLAVADIPVSFGILCANEVVMYDADLGRKEAAVVVNKMDLFDGDKMMATIVSKFPKHRVFFVSGRHRLGLEPLLMFLREKHEQFSKEREAKLEIDKEQLMM